MAAEHPRLRSVYIDHDRNCRVRRMTAQMLLPLHIGAAVLALVAGTVALAAAKGARLHRKSGMVFVYAMVTMCATAVVIAAVKGQTINLIAAVLTGYLVVTSLRTVRRPSPGSRWMDIMLMLVALVLGLTTLM